MPMKPDWRSVLTEVEESIADSLRSLPDIAAAAEPSTEPKWADDLNRIEGRINGLHQVIERTEAKVADLEAQLLEPERELSEALARLARAATALASIPGRIVN